MANQDNIDLSFISQQISGVAERINTIETRLDGIEARFDAIDARFDKIEHKIDRLAVQLAGVKGRVTDTESVMQSIANVITEHGLASI